MVRKDSFDGFNLIPGTHKFVQNGEIEVNFWFVSSIHFIIVLLTVSDTFCVLFSTKFQLKIEKPEGKDFIQLILFECCGPLEDPKQVARGGYKICASAVLHENTSLEVIRETLNDLAEQLERISRDSFYPGECEICLKLDFLLKPSSVFSVA